MINVVDISEMAAIKFVSDLKAPSFLFRHNYYVLEFYLITRKRFYNIVAMSIIINHNITFV